MPQPNFLIIGAQKCGTSWLARNLAKHPDVFMPPREVHFFDKAHDFARGRAWYEAHFEGAGCERAVGEKTPDYLWAHGQGAEGHLPDVHRNIKALYPDVRLVLVLRNPVERAISALNHLTRTGRVSPLHRADDLMLGDKQHLIAGHGIIEKGMYFRQLRAYLDVFPRDRFIILIYEEDVVRRPAQCLARVCEFIGVDPGYEFPGIDEKLNVFGRSTLGLTVSYYAPWADRLGRIIDKYVPSRKKRPSAETIARLYDLYEEENERLFDLLGRRLPSWRNPGGS